MVAKMTVSKWYGRSLTVPTYSSNDFTRFLVSSIGLVRSVLQGKYDKRIDIRFVQADTAYADQDKGLIAINGDFVDGRFPGRSRRVRSEQAIGVILGIIVHEAAHFAYSPPTLEPWSEYVKAHSKLPLHKQIAMTLGNIIEDIYIEAEVNRTIPSISWMLDCTNEIFFDDNFVKEQVGKGLVVEVAPVNLEQVEYALNLLILAKTRSEVKATDYMQRLFSEIQGAADMVKLEDRLALGLFIYEELLRNVPLDEMKGNSKSKGKGEGGEEGSSEGESGDEGEEEEGSGEAESRDFSEALEKAAGLTAEHVESGKPEPSRYPDRDVNLLEIDLANIARDEVSLSKSGRDEEIYIERVPLDSREPAVDERYERLAEIGRQRASVNRPYGQDRTRGTNIRKLYRIATDQKIFAERVQMSSYQPMQVLLLVDCSSSMLGWSGATGSSLIEAAASASFGAAKGLLDARCDVAIYGHTGMLTKLDETMIYRMKSFNEPFAVAGPRLGAIYQRSGMLSQNKDGRAIRYIAKKFSRSNTKRRLLIVLSDGEPMSPDYRGNYALEDTKQAVKEVRQQGIDVLSISIGHLATEPNNYIYGRDWNVSNESPEVLEDVIRTLLLR